MSAGKTEVFRRPFAVQTEGFARGLERLFTRVAKSADDHAALGMAAFTAVYLVCTVARSLARPLWFDKLMTFYISRVPGWQERLALGAVDGCPPLFYAITHACQLLFGENALASRLPAILGFWLMCVCLFLFVRRRAAAIYAFLAVLLAVGATAYGYAYEARPYGLILGMAGLSLWCWQSAGEGRRRILALVFLTFSIALAVNAHYYGAQIVAPLVAGEACRTLERKKIDWGVLSALALGLLPLIYLLPLAQRMAAAGFVRTSPVFWSKPHWGAALDFYSALLGPLLLPFFVGIAATATVYFLGGGEIRAVESIEQRFTLPEMFAAFGYLAMPVIMVLATRLKTSYWMDRYALTALLGCGILLVYLANVLAKDCSVIACLIIAALAGTWVFRTVRLQGTEVGVQCGVPAGSLNDGQIDHLPLVVADGVCFLQLARYGPPEVVSRLVYLTDVADAVHRPDFLPELSLAADRKILPGKVEDYAPFLNQHREFRLLLYGMPRLEWLPSRLREEGWKLEYQGQDNVLRVSRQDELRASR